MNEVQVNDTICTPFGVATVVDIIKKDSTNINDTYDLNNVELWFTNHYHLIFPNYQRPINTNTEKYVDNPNQLIYNNSPTLKTIRKLATYKDLAKGIKLNEIYIVTYQPEPGKTEGFMIDGEVRSPTYIFNTDIKKLAKKGAYLK